MINGPLVTVVAVTYGHMPFKLPSFVYQMLDQSSDRFKLVVIHDGPSSDGTREFMEQIAANYPDHVKYIETEARQHSPEEPAPCCNHMMGHGWGHYNRELGLAEVDTEWVWFQNCDNQVVPKAVEVLQGAMLDPKVDVVWFGLVHNYMGYEAFKRDFANCACDMAQFIVRTEIARKVGFNHRCFIADGLFIEDIKKANPNLCIAEIMGKNQLPTILTIHN